MTDEALLSRADLVGSVSGAKQSKKDVFAYTVTPNGNAIIDDSPLSIDCDVVDNYETDGFDNFIVSIAATYADEKILGENGKTDYDKFKPVLFEFPTYEYLLTG